LLLRGLITYTYIRSHWCVGGAAVVASGLLQRQKKKNTKKSQQLFPRSSEEVYTLRHCPNSCANSNEIVRHPQLQGNDGQRAVYRLKKRREVYLLLGVLLVGNLDIYIGNGFQKKLYNLLTVLTRGLLQVRDGVLGGTAELTLEVVDSSHALLILQQRPH
jgi:hypothetical protein